MKRESDGNPSRLFWGFGGWRGCLLRRIRTMNYATRSMSGYVAVLPPPSLSLSIYIYRGLFLRAASEQARSNRYYTVLRGRRALVALSRKAKRSRRYVSRRPGLGAVYREADWLESRTLLDYRRHRRARARVSRIGIPHAANSRARDRNSKVPTGVRCSTRDSLPLPPPPLSLSFCLLSAPFARIPRPGSAR